MENTLNIAGQERLHQFGNLELLAKQVVEGFIVGLHKSPFHGFSVEFAEHRLYNNGESVKNIDWKLYGRSDKLFVKRFEEETNLRCNIIIDCSSSMYFPLSAKKNNKLNNKIVFSILSAASLMYMFKRQRDAVGLSLFSEKIELMTPSKTTTSHQKLLFYELEKLLQVSVKETPKKTFVTEALHQIAESIHKRSMVIIFSDMFDNTNEFEKIFSALQHFRHNKHEVILFHVLDKSKEIEFNFDNRPHKFIDLETGKELKLNPLDIKQSYLEKVNEYKNLLKLKCGQYKIDYVEADINLGFEQVLLPYLLKRSKLY
ncbi:MAG: DUF58 domain-containing protein [Bacteroidota bacterium]|nr:DUF58 domain-containing protein [Bacteroidota bacterium]